MADERKTAPNQRTLFRERLRQRLDMSGQSDRQVSLAVTGKPDFIRDLFRTNNLPRVDNLLALANHLGTTAEWLTGTDDAQPGSVASPSRGFTPEPPIIGQTFNPQPAPHGTARDFPKNVPVLGNALGSSTDFSNGASGPMELIEMGEVVDMVRRPPGLSAVKSAYALYVMGDSQSPRFEPGELIYVNPNRPAVPGDDVVVQLVDSDGCTNCALVKRLVKRDGDVLVLRQFNPPHDFTVPLDRVRPNGIHRVMSFAELYGY